MSYLLKLLGTARRVLMPTSGFSFLPPCIIPQKNGLPLAIKFTGTFKEDKSATAGRLKNGTITPKAFFPAG
jgi:hypothetical protein